MHHSKYLIYLLFFTSEDRIKKGFDKLCKARHGSTQGRLDGFFKVTSVTPAKRKVTCLNFIRGICGHATKKCFIWDSSPIMNISDTVLDMGGGGYLSSDKYYFCVGQQSRTCIPNYICRLMTKRMPKTRKRKWEAVLNEGNSSYFVPNTSLDIYVIHIDFSIPMIYLNKIIDAN